MTALEFLLVPLWLTAATGFLLLALPQLAWAAVTGK